MEFRNLKTFVYVAELSSFTRAAEALGYSQSTVSFQIQQLEDELKLPLFERINHRITLTDKGRAVLSYAQEIIHLKDELEVNLKNDTCVSGNIRIAMASSLSTTLLKNTFLDFRRRTPGVSLTIISGGAEEMLHLMDRNEVDMVLTLDTHIYHTEYINAHEEQVHCHFVAGTSGSYADRYLGRQVSFDELLKEPFLLTEKGMSYRRLLDTHMASLSLEILPVLEVGDTELLCSLLAQGAGISFLPDFATREGILSGRLFYLDTPEIPLNLWRQLLYHKNKWISPAMQAVIEFLSQ